MALECFLHREMKYDRDNSRSLISFRGLRRKDPLVVLVCN